MTQVEKIESAIKGLSSGELAEFRRWYDEFDFEQWDDQIANDAKAGKLDHLVREARAEYKRGQATEI